MIQYKLTRPLTIKNPVVDSIRSWAGYMFQLFVSNAALGMLLLVMFIGRLAISGQGYLEDSDEVDYYAAEDAFDAIFKLDLIKFSQKIAITEGKPTETIYRVAQVPFHRLWAWCIDEPLHSPSSLWILGLMNIFVSVILLYVFYCLCIALNISKNASLLGVMLLGVLVNFNLYTRHILSYDTGLLLPLLSLLLIVRSDNQSKRFVLAGFIAALGFTSYHGHFMIYMIIGGYVWLMPAHGPINFKDKIKLMSKGFFPLLVFYELFFWIGGNSFIKETVKISGTIGQGSFSEGFAYAPLYLSEVEGRLGILLLIGFIISLFYTIIVYKKYNHQKLILLATIAYLLFGFCVYFLNIFVFYGRVFHLYIPFMVIGVVSMIERAQFLRYKVAIVFFYIALMFQYWLNIQSMNSFTYPRKVISELGLDIRNLDTSKCHFYYELGYSEDYINNIRFKSLSSSDATAHRPYPIAIVNACFFHHHPDRFIGEYRPYPNGNKKVLFSALHFMSYPAYTFEYCSYIGRSFYLKEKLKIQVVEENE